MPMSHILIYGTVVTYRSHNGAVYTVYRITHRLPDKFCDTFWIQYFVSKPINLVEKGLKANSNLSKIFHNRINAKT